MGFSAALHSRYATTHENRFWNKLVATLKAHYENKSENLLIAGNFIIEGKQIDALVIKDDAIIVIDFKDYGGTLSISENGSWIASGVVVNSTRKNPYTQLSDNKYGILNSLSRKLPSGYDNWVNLGHINALVLFHQDVIYDNNDIKHDLCPSASKWFSISDFGRVCQILDEITSSETLINGDNLFTLISALGLDEIPVYNLLNESSDEDVSMDPVPVATPQMAKIYAKSSVAGLAEFAEIYYSTARSLNDITLLIIGQDPYPEGANGVAFCKNSHYELYQADCCGGVVMRSFGYDRQRAFDNYKNPQAMFYDLLVSKGICFVNINNREFKSLAIDEELESTKNTREFNIDLVLKAKEIVLLGKDKTRYYFSKLYDGIEPDLVLIHPSLRAKQFNEEEWSEAWLGNTLQRFL